VDCTDGDVLLVVSTLSAACRILCAWSGDIRNCGSIVRVKDATFCWLSEENDDASRPSFEEGNFERMSSMDEFDVDGCEFRLTGFSSAIPANKSFSMSAADFFDRTTSLKGLTMDEAEEICDGLVGFAPGLDVS